MNQIKILLDRHFPYGTTALENAQNTIKKIDSVKSLPSPMARIYHVLDLYYRSFNADVVLGNRRTALMLGLLYKVYKPKKLTLIGYEIIFNFKENFKNKLVKQVWRVAVGKIDRLVVMTKSERTYLAREFKTSPDKFKTINFYAENADYIGSTPDGYIFSAGRMERDFETLLYSLRGTKYQAVIVADASQKEKLEKIKPSNVQIYYNIPKEEYLKLLRNAKMVVVPLYKGAASRGQVVILEAMKYGKPVICSKVDGTVDYLTDGQEGLFVDPQNPEDLRKIFDAYFHQDQALEKMGLRGFDTQRKKYSPEVFQSQYNKLILEEYKKKNNYPEVVLLKEEMSLKQDSSSALS